MSQWAGLGSGRLYGSCDLAVEPPQPLLAYPALPHDEDVPAESPQSTYGASVAGGVGFDLSPPVFLMSFRDMGFIASGVSMPEAAVDEYCHLARLEDEVRFARQASIMESVSKPSGM